MKKREMHAKHGRPGKSPAISMAEISLIFGYFLMVWLIPIGWLDTFLGAVLFAIASVVNPYLSEYSIAFAENPQYFIHCQVIATVVVAPMLFPLIVRRGGGLKSYAKLIESDAEKKGGFFLYGLLVAIGYAFLYFGLYISVDYPLSRGARAFWVSGVSLSAFLIAGVLSIGIGQLYMIFFAAIKSNKENQS